ncbi:MmgE/PrpD family protein [Bordetella petrii]|uniref:MmgE/PrpD family protein n=1 Tax=Bordetella petrii TaxID=94624 RepID=UPI001E2A1D8A|nr:MmgE/PrpD family protein [Bordetella petrii]MCD0502651.1 MmgE/PrpD family protein [Bordetella petrii]
MKAAELIGRFAAAFQPGRVTAPLRHLAARALLDTYAVAVAGRNEPAALRAHRYLHAQGMICPTDGRPGVSAMPAASLWGRADRANAEAAALYSGIAAHVLDYDDVTSPLRGHPSVVLWPALMALGQVAGLRMDRLLSGYVAGFEVMCKIARVMAVEHYARGWHSTSAIGVLGAAAACAHALRLDAEQAANAIGLAVAQAAGTRANFGSDAKSFQAGHANAAALRSVLLAQAGFTASSEVLDPVLGYSALYGQGQDLDGAMRDLGQGALELERSGLEVKKYPLCYATHRTLDGLLELRAEAGLTLQNVKRVQVRASPGALAPLIHHRPRTGLQAKFSMEYAVAAALCDGQVRLASFSDQAVMRPEIQAFLAEVDSAEAPGDSIFPRWAVLCVDDKSGRRHERRIEGLRGSAELPLSDAELIAKARDCFAWAGHAEDAAAFLARAGHPDTAARDLIQHQSDKQE